MCFVFVALACCVDKLAKTRKEGDEIEDMIATLTRSMLILSRYTALARPISTTLWQATTISDQSTDHPDRGLAWPLSLRSSWPLPLPPPAADFAAAPAAHLPVRWLDTDASLLFPQAAPLRMRTRIASRSTSSSSSSSSPISPQQRQGEPTSQMTSHFEGRNIAYRLLPHSTSRAKNALTIDTLLLSSSLSSSLTQ